MYVIYEHIFYRSKLNYINVIKHFIVKNYVLYSKKKKKKWNNVGRKSMFGSGIPKYGGRNLKTN